MRTKRVLCALGTLLRALRVLGGRRRTCLRQQDGRHV